MADSQDGKKRKDTAVSSTKGSKRRKYLAKAPSAAIPGNTRGFLVSCLQGKENKAAFEAIDLLKEFYDRPKGQQPQPAAAAPAETGAGGGSSAVNGSSGGAASDVAARLAAEVAELRDPAKKLFTWHNLSLPGLVYISMAPADGPGPVELVTAIAEEIVQTKTPRTFLCLRVIPVEAVCHASLEAIRKAAAPLVARSFRPAAPGAGTSTAASTADKGASADAAETAAAAGETAVSGASAAAAAGEQANDGAGAGAAAAAPSEAPLTFSVLYEHRASPPLERLAVINAVVDLIPKGTNKVDLGDPAKTVIVQLLKGSAMLAVVEGYPRLNKLNFRALRGEGGGEGEERKRSGKDKGAGKEKRAGGKEAGRSKGSASKGDSLGAGQEGSGAGGAAPGEGREGEPGPGPGSAERGSDGRAGGSGAGTAAKGDPVGSSSGAASSAPTANVEGGGTKLTSGEAGQQGSGEGAQQGGGSAAGMAGGAGRGAGGGAAASAPPHTAGAAEGGGVPSKQGLAGSKP